MVRDPVQIFDARFGAPGRRGRFKPQFTAAQVHAGIDADRGAARALGLSPMASEARVRLGQITPQNADDMLSSTESLFARKPALAAACGTTADFPRLIARSRAIAGGLIVIYAALAERCGRGRLRAGLELRDMHQDLIDACGRVLGDAATPKDVAAFASSARGTLVAIDRAPVVMQGLRRAAPADAPPPPAAVAAELHRLGDALRADTALPGAAAVKPPAGPPAKAARPRKARPKS